MPVFTIALKDVLDVTPDIGLNEYPIFDERYREGLNKKIIDHFWNQEIGHESISLFTFAMRRKMNEIMPLYNQQYLISQIKFDPLETVNIKNFAKSEANVANTGLSTTETNTANTGQSSTESASDAKSRAVASEHPQEHLSETGDYASSSQDNVSVTGATGSSEETNSTEQTGTAEETSTTEQTGTVDNVTTGFQGNAAVMIAQYRQTLMNIDMLIINELESLFMLLWSNGDEFSRGNDYGFYPYAW